MRWIRILCVLLSLAPSFARAADDLAGVRDLLLAGCHDATRDKLVKALHTLHDESNAPGEAAAWMLIGVNDISLGDVNSARVELDEAEIRFTALDDVFGAFLSNIAAAEIERQSDRVDRALIIQERGLALLERAADPRARFSIASMRTLAPVFGVNHEQLGPMEQFPEILKPLLLRFMDILGRANHAGTLMEAGKLDNAERDLVKANEEAGMVGGLFDAELGYRFGELRQRQWRLEEARALYLKALEGGPAMRMLSFCGPTRELSILEHLAELDLFSGKVEEALAWNDRALKLIRDARQPDLEDREIHSRASLLQKAGRYEEAVASYGQLLASAKVNGNRWLEASVESDLGMLYMFQGSYGTSARHAERAIELYQKVNEPYFEAPNWILLAEIEMYVELDDGATEALDRARALADKSGFKLAGAMVDLMDATMKSVKGKGSAGQVQNAVGALLALPDMQGELDSNAIGWLPALLQFGSGSAASLQFSGNISPSFRALPLLAEGKVLFEHGEQAHARAIWEKALQTNPNNDLRAGILALIAASYWKDGNHEDAIGNFRKAAATLEAGIGDIKVEAMLTGYLGGSRHFYFDLLIDSLVQEGQWREAFAQSERARGRAFLQMIGNRRLDGERGANAGLVHEAEILRHEISASERRPTNNSDATRLRERYQTLLTRVKVSNPEYASMTNVEPLHLEEVQKDLPPDVTLVSYFVTTNGVHVWVIAHEDAHSGVLPIGRDGLRRITCWARSLGAPAPRGVRVTGECSDGATAGDAFNLLIAPIRSWLRSSRLMIIPHGVLHYVPFAALHDRATNRDLIDDFTITYAPSASSLRFLRAKESPVDGGSLVLGDPATSLPPLPGAAEEAHAVAHILNTTAHIGDAARESLLFDLHGKTDLIHLAAHGIYDGAHPLFSRIVLASKPASDGNLTVQDILSSLDLTGVNLVVLSACQSAVGARSGGDEVVGLTRSLLYAGTPGVISTLWNIDDASSAGLMEDFYKHLRGGASVAEALREAQLATRGRMPDPRYWAAFTLNGDPQGRWNRARP
jgi:tetratricopeptide (TPR) repeat protein